MNTNLRDARWQDLSDIPTILITRPEVSVNMPRLDKQRASADRSSAPSTLLTPSRVTRVGDRDPARYSSLNTQGLSFGASSSYITFSYHQARLNRMAADRIGLGCTLDITVYKPIFVYDILSFPGSLVNVLGVSSSLDIVNRMTPGIVHGYALNIERGGAPILQAGRFGDDTARGMMVFGRGGRDRRTLSNHYGECYEMAKVDVEIRLKDGYKVTMPAFTWIPVCQETFLPQPTDSGNGAMAVDNTSDQSTAVHTQAKSFSYGNGFDRVNFRGNGANLVENAGGDDGTSDQHGTRNGEAQRRDSIRSDDIRFLASNGNHEQMSDNVPVQGNAHWNLEQYVAGQLDSQSDVEW
ncbi:hypothetical protein BDV97DRAFT_38607 [Delphinella strobiligena]|nr:hypothetical protein BDV97DRAFT_38607 [Delphinella strobiligena]